MKSIDLHGIRHEFVVRKLDSFFWQSMNSNSMELEIITGVSDKMKDIVRRTCKDYNFKVIDHPLNLGCLIVTII